jgi:hypothetical protein
MTINAGKNRPPSANKLRSGEKGAVAPFRDLQRLTGQLKNDSKKRQEMTDIIFKPYFHRSAPTWVVEARWKTKNAHRRVFIHDRGKSHLRAFCSLTRSYITEGRAAGQHLAEVLNLWITTHSEEELNDLVWLIDIGGTDNPTPAENVLLGEYLLLGGERF